MKKNHLYSEYNVNLISLNYIINEIVEPAIQRFCIDNDIKIISKSRDIRKLTLHFIADSIISTCIEFKDHRNVLNLNTIVLTILGDDMNQLITKSTHQLLRKFKLCNTSIDQPLDNLCIDQIYDIKSRADQCSIKPKSISNIKKYLNTNELIHLHKLVKHNIATQHILYK